MKQKKNKKRIKKSKKKLLLVLKEFKEDYKKILKENNLK